MNSYVKPSYTSVVITELFMLGIVVISCVRGNWPDNNLRY